MTDDEGSQGHGHARPGPGRVRPKIARGRLRRTVLVAVAALLAVAVPVVLVSGNGHGQGASAAAGAQVPASSAALLVPAQLPAAAATTATPKSAAQLRAVVTAALAEHVVVTDRLSRAGLRGDRDLTAVAQTALTRDGNNLRAALAALFGADVARRFQTSWTGSLTSLFAYARARAEGDSATASTAKSSLAGHTRRMSALLAATTRGGLSPAVAQAGFASYAKGLVGHVDAYARRDYPQAYTAERTTYAQSFVLGWQVAEGLAGAAGFTPEALKPAAQAGLSMQRLLGEHAALAVDTTRAGLAGWPDFPAAAAALDANTAEIDAAVQGVLGAPAARRFSVLWADQVDGLVGYGKATARKDEAAARKELQRLGASSQGLGTFFATATGGRLAAARVTSALQLENGLLVRQITDSRASDEAGAQAASFDALENGMALGAELARALGATAAARGPRGGAQTGLGGMAAWVGRR